ncbi:hypothetical protein [Halomonas sp. BM-2019]|uniref:hypothetical protein n=1 Tax=Halomonas sp. BM-2019 TaxID=2811227 RepID=UPI001B3C24FA|nr:MAG: hypothetical protein J5F18_13040 [Halomonas sp. BM-2019]
MIDLDAYFAEPVLKELERAVWSDDARFRDAAVAALTVCQECAEDPDRLLPLPVQNIHGVRDGEVVFRVYRYGPLGSWFGRYELILACPQGGLPFRAIYFGPRRTHSQRTSLIHGELKRFWRCE